MMNNFSIGAVDLVENPQPLEYKPQDLTSPRAGFFASEIDKRQKQALDLDLMRRNQHYFASDLSPAGRSKTEKARLVKDCKSPTRSRSTVESAKKSQALAAFYGYLNRKGVKGVNLGEKSTLDVVQPVALTPAATIAHIPEVGTVNTETGEVMPALTDKSAIVRLSHRAWADEYRMRVTTNASPLSPPPSQAGDRHTKFLTTRAAKNILDSGAYVAAVRGGYSTFLTLTFNAEARERINSGDSTIGAECSRFFDALQKMYQRGWSVDNEVLKTRQGFKCIGFDGEEIKEQSRQTFNSIGASEVIEPDGDKLDYLWVAEAPTKPKVVSRRNGFECYGEVKPNPHCHVLMRWNVEPYLFHDWAHRIESLWGQGFAKLERIKNPQAASGYMLKALGYLLKGEQESDQGEIKGNRYNISKSARALPWENIASFHAEHMSSLIGEIKCKFENRAKPTLHKIKQAKKSLDKSIRDKAFLKSTKQNLSKVNIRIKAIEKSISDFKADLRKSPVRANDYMITFKGGDSLRTFLNWAVGVRGWNATDSSQAPEKSPLEKMLTSARAGIRKTYSRVRNRFIEKQILWGEWLAEKLPPQVDNEKLAAEYAANYKEYELCQMN
ncbi:hypothetical protein [Shewanella fidelis]|uniref:Uncharacterized protein n=2 Tax=Shewanella fidelis TaxID=173509 RepID=A0AAW8NLV7_9GAMM|nr:hypothetical protein [Shewanella fidelis]MDR8523852.1 hypothetical protein [Shewanella fidelis]MDW4810400.1 hypothetical protein [Shewanella fidelis]